MSDTQPPTPVPPPSNSTWFGIWALIAGAVITIVATGIIWGIGGGLFAAGLFMCAGGGALVTRGQAS